MRVADPVSCRPGIDVQVPLLSIAVLNGIDATGTPMDPNW